MKVIFRLTKLGTPDEYRNLAHRIFMQWNETPDLGCLVVPPDVEVYVVDSDSNIEVKSDHVKHCLFCGAEIGDEGGEENESNS